MPKKNLNIDWGSGKVNRGRWLSLKNTIKDYKVKSVIEFGSGLSTELLSLEDIELWSLEILKDHCERVKEAISDSAKLVHYEYRKLPEINRKFDLAFIDGPSGNRDKELELSNKIAKKVIFCDDWQRGQDKVKLDKRWKLVWNRGYMMFADKNYLKK